MIFNEIHDGLAEWLKVYDFVVHGLRQGGHLAYLRDKTTGRLVPFEKIMEELGEEPIKLGGPKLPMIFSTNATIC